MDRRRLMLEEIDYDEAPLEELVRVLVDHHLADQGLLGAAARRADILLREDGE